MDKDTFFTKKRLVRIGGIYWDFDLPKVMGILNLTPDSFYDGGRYKGNESIMAHVHKMLDEGADIIDIGGYSSRPGAENISEEEEFSRLSEALKAIRQKYPDIILSVDTFRSTIARKVVEEFSVNMINDISAGQLDPLMFDTIADLNIPYIIMHMKGTPDTMQNQTVYTDLLKEVIGFLGKQAEILREKGINDIIVDPGFGFGKTLDHNYQLLAHLDILKMLQLPVLVGVSRKSMIYKLLDTSPENTLNATTAVHMLALERGADILRVHDVKEAREAIQVFLKTKAEGCK